jgi:hypothetical protein
MDMMNNFVVGAQLSNWINHTGSWVLGAIALGCGFVLIISGIVVITINLMGTTQSWGKALAGLLIGIVGGLIGWWGASSMISFFKNQGKEIPHS